MAKIKFIGTGNKRTLIKQYFLSKVKICHFVVLITKDKQKQRITLQMESKHDSTRQVALMLSQHSVLRVNLLRTVSVCFFSRQNFSRCNLSFPYCNSEDHQNNISLIRNFRKIYCWIYNNTLIFYFQDCTVFNHFLLRYPNLLFRTNISLFNGVLEIRIYCEKE